jgi:hypothetical protein
MTRRTRHRAGVVVAAPVAALLGWAAVRAIGVDLDLKSDAVGGGKVGGGDVLAASLVAALAAWLVVAAIERRLPRPRRAWTLVGSTALAVTVVGPTWLADGASAVCLIALHAIVAAVVIAGFSVTLPSRCRTPVTNA